MPTVTIINTGIANIASVAAACSRLGAAVEIVRTPQAVERAERLVLPGVGAFAAGMRALTELALVEPLRRRLITDRPTLCICLGLQLLCRASEESPGVIGLGLIEETVQPFPRTVRTPQFGWNRVTPVPGSRLLSPGFASFANSYRLSRIPQGWGGATAEHAGTFVAALERGNTLACQFHPELSGPWGLALLERWMDASSLPPARGEGDGRNEVGKIPRPEVADQTGVVTPGVSRTALTRRVIPCLDIRNGRVVKGVKFADLRDAGDPVECAARYESQGADELIILDVSATPEGRSAAIDTVRAVRAVLSIPLTVGGGVRTIDDAHALLDAGADKVAVNSAAVERPELLAELASSVGAQCVVLAIDAARRPDTPPAHRHTRVPPESAPRWEIVTRSGTNRTPLDAAAWAAEGQRRGAGEILLTSFDRDGTREGYDLELLRAIAGVVTIPVIASGGASTAHHMAEAFGAGADAVLAASIFHDAHETIAHIKAELAGAGLAVRLEPDPTGRGGASAARPPFILGTTERTAP